MRVTSSDLFDGTANQQSMNKILCMFTSNHLSLSAQGANNLFTFVNEVTHHRWEDRMINKKMGGDVDISFTLMH